ncbi:MAG: hypothetical protein QF654_10375 [Alphaproteobacteria bacterium]|jgi:hypothetical protein|nr:hypothetical protein [Alphaproteobacteria bacterium]|tara:strand:- start:80 stop:346 length:267 start_codon:yes stop_codon:yes gene_type:complete
MTALPSRTDAVGETDRRGLHKVVKFTNPGAVEQMKAWLEKNCEGEWSIGIPDMESAARWGNYRIKFERKSDLSRLSQMLAVYWPQWMN